MAKFVALTGFHGQRQVAWAAMALHLGWEFVDLDADVVKETGMTISDLFETRGEQAFRAEECRLLGEIVGDRSRVRRSGRRLGEARWQAREAADAGGEGGLVFGHRAEVAWRRSSGAIDRWHATERSSRALLARRREILRSATRLDFRPDAASIEICERYRA